MRSSLTSFKIEQKNHYTQRKLSQETSKRLQENKYQMTGIFFVLARFFK